MDKNEIVELALETKGRKESITIICINYLESLYERIDMEDLKDIKSFLAKYHRKYYPLEGINLIKESKNQCECKHLSSIGDSKNCKCNKCGQIWRLKDGKWYKINKNALPNER